MLKSVLPMKSLTGLFFILSFSTFCSQTVKGTITDEDGVSLPAVTVINISADHKTSTAMDGTFSVEASTGDEIRFVRAGYERAAIKASADTEARLHIRLVRAAREIEEVRVPAFTGDLGKDSRAVAKADRGKMVQDAVGLPQPVGKMRERPAEVKQVLLPILVGQVDVQGLYDLISGKARRQKRKYRYDDLQQDIAWIRNRVEDEYFSKQGIPQQRISEFIEFSFAGNSRIRAYIRTKNLSAALMRIDEQIPVFAGRVKQDEKSLNLYDKD